MKKYFFLLLICLAWPLGAAQLPDNMYFRAMNDEMRRTQKQSPKPCWKRRYIHMPETPKITVPVL